MRTPLVALVLAACTVEPQTAHVTPFDGQTAWPVEQPIEVTLPLEALPKGYPADPSLLRVVDLDAGGVVEGDVVADGRTLRFYPLENWAPGHDFVWVLDPPITNARQPALAIPQRLLGEARFSTASHLEAVDVVVDGTDVCVLLSRAYRGSDAIRISVDGEAVPVWDIVAVTVAEVNAIQAGALNALCAPLDAAPDTVRIEIGGEVFQLSPHDGDALTGFQDLHRVTK